MPWTLFPDGAVNRWWLVWLGVTACSNPWQQQQIGPWRVLDAVLRANNSGSLPVIYRAGEADDAIQISVRPSQSTQKAHLRQLELGRRPIYACVRDTQNRRCRSGAGNIARSMAFNWPIDSSDGGLSTERYTARIGILGESNIYEAGSAQVQVAFRSGEPVGDLLVNIVYAGDISDDGIEAVEEAVEVWRGIYRSVGIDIDVETYDLPQRSLEPPGVEENGAYAQIARSTRYGGVNVVMVDELVGFPGALGVAGGIPGPLANFDNNAVAVNTTYGAGPDGVYSPLEVELLAETIAHEVGHFMGLFHPVETDFQRWDPLSDTTNCGSRDVCVDVLGDNLMFPYPICQGTDCVVQQGLTDDQSDVMWHFTGLR